MLETEIKNLTKQIEKLNNNFEKFFKESATPHHEPQVDEHQLELEQNDPVVTPESFRDLCMIKSREDKSLKPKIKKILADLGAKVVDDLSPEDLVTANEQVRAL